MLFHGCTNRRTVVVIAAAALLISVCQAVIAAPVAMQPQGPVLVPGIVGNAFLVDSQEHEFSFRTKGTFNPACGTVEFWVQPQREIGKEDFQGMLYQTFTPEGGSRSEGLQLMLCGKGLMVHAVYAAGNDVVRAYPVHFVAKSWHHIALGVGWQDGTTLR